VGGRAPPACVRRAAGPPPPPGRPPPPPAAPPGVPAGPAPGRLSAAGSGRGGRLDRAADGPARAGGHRLCAAADALGSAAAAAVLRGRLGRWSLDLVERRVGLGSRALGASAQPELGLLRALLRVPR